MKGYIAASQEHIKKERHKARELRKTSWWKQKLAEGKCYYCEESFPQEELNMDHKIPLVRGGFSRKGNLVVSCQTCNIKKKDSLSMDFID